MKQSTNWPVERLARDLKAALRRTIEDQHRNPESVAVCLEALAAIDALNHSLAKAFNAAQRLGGEWPGRVSLLIKTALKEKSRGGLIWTED